MRLRRAYSVHQVSQLALELRGHGVLLSTGPPRHHSRVQRLLRAEDPVVLCEQASDEGATALLQAPHDVCTQHVAILLQESLRLVLHPTGEVPNDEVTRPILDDIEVLVFDVRLKQFGAPLLGAPAHDRALVVEHREHASFAGADELDDGRVVWKIARIPLHTFPSIQHRLVLENHLVEILLQQLIGEVDEELLQRVPGKEFKAKNVKHPDKRESITVRSASGRADRVVDSLDHEGKHGAIQMPRKSIPALGCFHHGDRHADHALSGGLHGLSAEGGRELAGVHLQELAAARHHVALGGGQLRALGVGGRRRELQVPQVQHGHDGTEQSRGVLALNTEALQRNQGRVEILGLVDTRRELVAPRASQEGEVLGSEAQHATQLHTVRCGSPCAAIALACRSRQGLVENVEVALSFLLAHDTHLLEEVGVRERADQPRGGAGIATRGAAELQLDVLAEARGVVVPQGLRVAEGLQQRIGPQHLTLHAR
mmetsp:Transcript_174927/g.555364  ORF Transcript_174927/g.555364 Transcript_174927/m.555364 type:complete len:485 (-) Transcript_174927:769-2223(-)